jgi:nucleoside-diphosphate-sugar epimerase
MKIHNRQAVGYNEPRPRQEMKPMILPKLLITGHSGLIGKILWRGLADSFELYGVDVCLSEQTGNVFRADISNPEQINTVFERIPALACVVHLAGDPRADADWQSVLVNNIAGTRNLYEAARAHGVKRVVFASSNHVTGAYEGFPRSLHTQENPTLITTQYPIRPDGYYGVSKAAGEAIARMYYEVHGLESICLRIGSVLKDDDPARHARNQSIWLSHRDLVQLVKKSLLAEVRFAIYYGVSNNRKRFWDIADAMAEIGYQPEDDASTR